MSCTNNFPPPNTHLQCLQLCASLKDSSDVKNKVIQKLKTDLLKYCAVDYLGEFANTSGSNGYLKNVFKHSDALLNGMFKNDATGVQYNNLDDKHSGCGHIPMIANSLCRILPQVYSALYFLYFNVSDVFQNMGGGQWSGLGLKQSEQNLHKWLSDQIGSDPKIAMIRRGFMSEELKSHGQEGTQGSALATVIQTNLLKHDTSDGALQKALLPMLFICPWSVHLTGHALLGHALCFLHEFCKEVDKQQTELEKEFLKKLAKDPALSQAFDVVHKFLSEVDLKKLKSVCNSLKTKLNDFITGTDIMISAVCQSGNTNLYNGVFGQTSANKFPAHFPYYVQWLCGVTTMAALPDPEPSPVPEPPRGFLLSISDSVLDAAQTVLTSYGTVKDFFTGKDSRSVLARIIMSLNQMKHECRNDNWDQNKLQNAKTAGPFRYGFVPKNDSNWESIKSNLPTAISALVPELESLYGVLQPWHSMYKGIAAGTVGGTAAGGTMYYAYSQYGSTVTPGVSALLDDVASFGFSVSDLAGAGLHCPLQ